MCMHMFVCVRGVCVCVYTHLINIYTRFIFILQINWSFFHTPCVWHVTFGWGTTRVSFCLLGGREYGVFLGVQDCAEHSQTSSQLIL